MAGDGGRRERADAARNRERLVEVARQAFASGGSVTLEGIARQAGVGIGTLYRHFPSREALVEAVYRAERARLCARAGELLAQDAAERALRRWMDDFAEYVATKRGMAETLRALIAAGAVTRAQAREELSGAVGELLAAGAAAGTLRGDVPAEDVLASLVGVCLACGPQQREQAGRLMDLLVDGLRRSG